MGQRCREKSTPRARRRGDRVPISSNLGRSASGLKVPHERRERVSSTARAAFKSGGAEADAIPATRGADPLAVAATRRDFCPRVVSELRWLPRSVTARMRTKGSAPRAASPYEPKR